MCAYKSVHLLQTKVCDCVHESYRVYGFDRHMEVSLEQVCEQRLDGQTGGCLMEQSGKWMVVG